MMNRENLKLNSIDLRGIKSDIRPSMTHIHGLDVNGREIKFTNRYMERDGKPFFGISGEFQYSRYDCNEWEDELIKMKMGGINIVATYVFWSHHEEVKGNYIWNGNKDLRKFIELCKKYNLDVILRIGPWDHGEVRNGGYPDWIYSEPLIVRSNDELYLYYVKQLFEEIGKQVQGLLFDDGGPIIGVQLENEFQHACAEWEVTVGTSDEFIPQGFDGNNHILKLKETAEAAGVSAPMYTGTGWGGAIADPDTVVPLWGGYAFWPWIFYGTDITEHPPTPEFIYRDYRYPTYNFDPKYDPMDIPYVACEMGGGMNNFYSYRFKLPYQSVDAMANVKVASGCNFVGYYVYHGGSNPRGIKTPYLNEWTNPKISYDFQAPLSEFGLARESYYRLKREHYFFTNQQEQFCLMETVLPEGAQDIQPEDVETLRYAIRQKDNSGFIFINNYQDHINGIDKENQKITLQLENEVLEVPYSGGFNLKSEESCILPFNFKMDQVLLKTSTTQFISKLNCNGAKQYFFFQPKGMKPELVFDVSNIKSIDSNNSIVEYNENEIVIYPQADELSKINITTTEESFDVYILTDKQSMEFWQFKYEGTDNVLLSKDVLLVDENGLRIESDSNEIKIQTIDGLITPNLLSKVSEDVEASDIVKTYTLIKEEIAVEYTKSFISKSKMLLTVDTSSIKSQNLKDIILQIDYVGDVGNVFYENNLINDNFNNDDTWEVGLRHNVELSKESLLYFSIIPIRENAKVKTDSPMAARSEESASEIVGVKKINLKKIYEFKL